MAKKQGASGMNLTKSQRFWLTQKECWKRMTTPYIMYVFMSMLLLATQEIGAEGLVWLRITLGTLCILIAAAFNAHLAYTAGIAHYDAFLTGNIHRRNIEQGIASGGDHHTEREYAPWKGFYIGFLVGVPVLLFAGLACIPGAMNEELAIGRFMLIMFAGFAIVPVSWVFEGLYGGMSTGAYAWSMLFVLLPIIVTGVFYIIGAHVEKKRKQVIEERQEEIEKTKNAPKVYREQTEEQKRKTLQSKKKKR